MLQISKRLNIDSIIESNLSVSKSFTCSCSKMRAIISVEARIKLLSFLTSDKDGVKINCATSHWPRDPSHNVFDGLVKNGDKKVHVAKNF